MVHIQDTFIIRAGVLTLDDHNSSYDSVGWTSKPSLPAWIIINNLAVSVFTLREVIETPSPVANRRFSQFPKLPQIDWGGNRTHTLMLMRHMH